MNNDIISPKNCFSGSIRFCESSCFLQFWLSDSTNQPFNKPSQMVHFSLYQSCLRLLQKIGFSVTKHPGYQEEYKCLSPSHRYGVWKALEVNIEIFQGGFKFEFFQNINTGDRPKGRGEHCYNKFELMDYLMKKRFLFASRCLIKVIQKENEFAVEYVDSPKNAKAAILKHCQGNHWRKFNPGTLEEIAASEQEWAMSYGNASDRDKKMITSGKVKFFRDWRTGRLMKGIAFHNINNMWWVLINDFTYTNIASFDLFDPTDEDFARRRKKKNSMPDSKKKELEFVKSLSEAKLKKLLRDIKKMHTSQLKNEFQLTY